MLKRFMKKDNLEYEFLPAALEIIETPVSPKGRMVIWMIFIIIFVAILWAYFGKVDEVAVARGKVIPDGRIKTIQPFEESIVTSIYVDEGQRVKKGQLLIELDSSIKDTDVESIKKSLETAQVEKNLLKKIMNGGNLNCRDFNDVLSEEAKKNLLQLSQTQNADYQVKQETQQLVMLQCYKQYVIEKTELVKLQSTIPLLEEKTQELKVLYDSGGIEKLALEKIGKTLEILQKEESDLEELWNDGAIPKKDWEDKSKELILVQKEYETQKAKVKQEHSNLYLNWKNASDEIFLTKSELQSQVIRVEQAKIKYEEAQKNIEKLKKETDAVATNSIVEKDKSINELDAELKKAQKNVSNQYLRSPVNGIVHGLVPNTIGGVVTPAQPVLTIVPDDTKLVVEALVLNKDIGFIKVNQEVTLKFDTFSFQKYGMIKGKVTSISPDVIEDEKLGSVYRIKVSLEKTVFKIKGEKRYVSPGMTVTAEIKTGKRRIIEFFLEPIMKYSEESLKLR
jgi:hemolysin D